MTLPNAVIAGAPKCGTSSLFRWLADHPEVCPARVKETRYLVDADSPLRVRGHSYHDHKLSGYEAYFAECASGFRRNHPPRVILEATPDYLYQKTARSVLSSLEPQPHIVFLLRRPSARVYSHYQFARNNMALLTPSMTFAEFVDAARRDLDGPLAGMRNLRHVLRYSRYADHLEPWLSCFQRDRIHVYLLEGMQRDPQGFMAKTAADVGIDAQFYARYSFPRVNETIQIRSRSLQRLRNDLGTRLPAGRLKAEVRKLYERVNLRPPNPGPAPDDREVLAELDAEFGPSVRRLASMLDLDLSEWE